MALSLLLLGQAVAAPKLQLLETRADFKSAALNRVVLGNAVALQARLQRGSRNGSLETAVLPATFDTAVLSWNALTPAGTSILLEVRARVGGRFTRYYPIARWGGDAASRYSFGNSADGDGRVETDTLELKRMAGGVQIRVTLESKTLGVSPVLQRLAIVTSDSKTQFALQHTSASRDVLGLELAVPLRSQMLYAKGNVLCSPTSVGMVLAFWDEARGTALAQNVPDTADAVWDSTYKGAGNWPFNTAYAASRGGVRAYVSRLSTLAQTEAFLRRGVPLVLSVGWGVGELPGAHLPKSVGHLLVLRGFAQNGDPVINDPAAPSDAKVRTVYPRAAFERAWLTHSGGVIYVIEPE